jgi:pimeloyl-ACP methyl ester carboxylesterase
MPRFTTSDGLSLHFEDEGSGLAVLCLSGLTRDARDFDYAMPTLLGAGCRVIRLDYRGRGQSDWSEDFMTYNLVRESLDALELLAHLELPEVAVLGTSRGGLIAMGLAATAKDALLGVALVDIGPELHPGGLEAIMGYLGRKPSAKTLTEAAGARAHVMRHGFPNVPMARWREEVGKFFVQTEFGLELSYDPKLRDAVEAAGATAVPDLWPYYMACSGLPLAVIRGANSDLLSAACYAQMLERIPEAIGANVPDRAHVPFLDEAESIAALQAWIGEMQ